MTERLSGTELKVTVYTPASPVRNPGKLAQEMIRDLFASRELAWRLFVRDVSAQYRQTFLGYVWAFLPPLVASMTFIFLNSQGIVQVTGTNIPYPAFAMMGTLLWQVFVDAMQSPSQAINQAKPMLAKINFPREAILLAGLYLVGFNFLIRLVLLVGVMLWWKVVPGAGLLLFVPAIAALVVCGLACGLAIAPIGSLYGDIGRAIPIAAGFWMLLTPVLYPPRVTGLAGWLATWNPVSSLMVTARESLTAQPFTMLPIFALVFACSLVLLFLGWIGYRIAMPHLIARMGG
jgi:lipopolysaccharide transport system permease protein